MAARPDAQPHRGLMRASGHQGVGPDIARPIAQMAGRSLWAPALSPSLAMTILAARPPIEQDTRAGATSVFPRHSRRQSKPHPCRILVRSEGFGGCGHPQWRSERRSEWRSGWPSPWAPTPDALTRRDIVSQQTKRDACETPHQANWRDPFKGRLIPRDAVSWETKRDADETRRPRPRCIGAPDGPWPVSPLPKSRAGFLATPPPPALLRPATAPPARRSPSSASR